MRDFKADEEEATYDRKGPLTIPAGFSDTEEFVSSGNKSASDDTEYLEAAKAHSYVQKRAKVVVGLQRCHQM